MQFCFVLKQHVGSQNLQRPGNGICKNVRGKLSFRKMCVGNCQLGKCPWEIVIWENVCRKLSNGNMYLGYCHWGKCRCKTVILVNAPGKLSFGQMSVLNDPASTFYESFSYAHQWIMCLFPMNIQQRYLVQAAASLICVRIWGRELIWIYKDLGLITSNLHSSPRTIRNFY